MIVLNKELCIILSQCRMVDLTEYNFIKLGILQLKKLK